jgi:hypothetical protein
VRLIAAGVLAAAAVVVGLLAADVRAWRDEVRRDDARYLFVRGSRPDWRADTLLPRGLSGRVVGVEPDAELRRALVLFRRAGRPATPFGAQERQGERGAAEAALQPLAQSANTAIASQASDLLGLLAFSDPGSGSREGPTPAERALAYFQQAYRLDVENEAAKTNLELALRLLQARGARPGANAGAGPRGTGRRGAGAGQPGRGY